MIYDKNVLNPIAIDGWTFPANFASYKVENTREDSAEVEKMSNGEYDVDNVDMCYRPKVELTFGVVDIEDYRAFIRKINQRKFNLTYYDYELKKPVTRVMRMSSREINRLFAQLSNVFGVFDLSVSCFCVYGYASY
ncbi:MAG: hypothetical protein RR327_06985, partial [Clostridia bacterium]